jgi:hypothetical protein
MRAKKLPEPFIERRRVLRRDRATRAIARFSTKLRGIRASRGVVFEHHAKRDTHLATHRALERVIANERGWAIQERSCGKKLLLRLRRCDDADRQTIAACARAQLRRRLPTFRDPEPKKRNDKFEAEKQRVEPKGIEPSTSCMPCRRSPK